MVFCLYLAIHFRGGNKNSEQAEAPIATKKNTQFGYVPQKLSKITLEWDILWSWGYGFGAWQKWIFGDFAKIANFIKLYLEFYWELEVNQGIWIIYASSLIDCASQIARSATLRVFFRSMKWEQILKIHFWRCWPLYRGFPYSVRRHGSKIGHLNLYEHPKSRKFWFRDFIQKILFFLI